MTGLFLSNRGTGAILLVFSLALAHTAGADGLSEVRQTVFGMDCAPCAHGLDEGLSELDGVEGVSVSLNDGYALIRLTPDNPVTLEQIRTVIRESGFTPKEAMVVLSGKISRVDDRLVIADGSGRQLSLAGSASADSAWRQLQALPDGVVVTIEGRVAEADSSRIAVLEVR